MRVIIVHVSLSVSISYKLELIGIIAYAFKLISAVSAGCNVCLNAHFSSVRGNFPLVFLHIKNFSSLIKNYTMPHTSHRQREVVARTKRKCDECDCSVARRRLWSYTRRSSDSLVYGKGARKQSRAMKMRERRAHHVKTFSSLLENSQAHKPFCCLCTKNFSSLSRNRVFTRIFSLPPTQTRAVFFSSPHSGKSCAFLLSTVYISIWSSCYFPSLRLS